jgi:hypothetical protein
MQFLILSLKASRASSSLEAEQGWGAMRHRKATEKSREFHLHYAINFVKLLKQ